MWIISMMSDCCLDYNYVVLIMLGLWWRKRSRWCRRCWWCSCKFVVMTCFQIIKNPTEEKHGWNMRLARSLSSPILNLGWMTRLIFRWVTCSTLWVGFSCYQGSIFLPFQNQYKVISVPLLLWSTMLDK